jgi:very-short-patch-repair endonuclease
MKDVKKELLAVRQKLLDLTMRNRLLNFRQTRARTVRIVDEIPRELYEILVLKEKAMEFLPRPKTPEDSQHQAKMQKSLFEEEVESHDTLDLSAEEASKLWEVPPPDAELATRYTDRFLQTQLDSQTLQKRLFYIFQEARSILEELGYSTLYLALGYLEWTEGPESTQTRQAPLILVPVELERTTVRSSFKLRWTGEDVSTNISLQAILSQEGLSLPDFVMPDDETGIDKYYQSVVKSISIRPKWRVVNDIYLGFFSFTKFIMYKDLDLKAWPEKMSPLDHPLIRSILDPSNEDEDDFGFNEEEVDEKLVSQDLYHIMDADSSQIAVIEDVKSGRNLVAEGPPGTGKSQTIANIIAEALSAGKSVLFISEKMAALEVVKNRLDKVGLGDFCLELHSRKSNKKEVLKELERTIQKQPPTAISLERKFDRLETLKSELNGYVKALREPFAKFQRSPFELFCMKEKVRRHFAQVGREMPRVKLTNPEKCDEKQYAQARLMVENISHILPLARPISGHPWRGCNPGIILPSDEGEIRVSIDQCKMALDQLRDSINRLTHTCAVRIPTSVSDLPRASEAAKIILDSMPTDKHVLLNPEWNEVNEKAKTLISNVQAFRSQLSVALSKFTHESLDEDIPTILEEYEVRLAKCFFLRLFDARYKHLTRKIRTLYKTDATQEPKMIISDLRELAYCLRFREDLRQAADIGRALFGSYWQAEESNPELLQDFAKWVVSYRKFLLEGAITEASLEIVSTGIPRKQLETEISEVAQAGKKFIAQRDIVVKQLGADCEAVFGVAADEVPLLDCVSRLEIWKAELPKLRRWAQFTAYRDDCVKTIAKPLLTLIEEDKLEPEDVLPCFEGNFADELLRIVFAQRPVLANFEGILQEKKIREFGQLDQELIELNRRRLVFKLYQERPSIRGGASTGSEVGILLGEFSRKRGHMPIRKLLSQTIGLIQKIKPCFMMSPLSIAQFLDPRNSRFDLIVFDEASQVRPEDALGALLRGKQVVVMGDTHQLPPTTFFDRMLEDIDTEDQDVSALATDVESILHQCKRCFPTKLLRWHYRSRHESLIAVSNQEFYDNQLLIYPSPIAISDSLGLKFVHLPNSIYDRGRSGVNREEARVVAESAVEHYRRFPDKSLGVGAFNIRQQEAILEEVELQLRLHPEIEDLFKSDRYECFFVKNLETIQGDERDVIFLSIGFGRDAGGRLTLNFGPLNQEGGERRLNVLITRARERCVVFSNFRACDLSVDASAPVGLRALKVFLDFAENRNLYGIMSTREDTESPFEDAVYDFLRSHNYEVRKQVGCAGFRVDLAVVDAENQGSYLLGVECDGRKYHCSPVARDRDRLREQILRRLGWRIHRVWSTDWYRSRSECEKRILEALNTAKQERNSSVGNPSNDCVQSSEVISTNEESKREETSNTSLADDPLETVVPDYELCSSLDIDTYGELHEYPIQQLSKAVAAVVVVESPVHVEEVVRRLRSLWGLKRSGQRIHNAIGEAISLADKKGLIRRRGDFLWSVKTPEIPVRRRNGDPPPNIELICDEEIAEAVKLVLKTQFATILDDLIVRTCRILGIQATRTEVADRISKIIKKLIHNKMLQKMPNGMINFA